MKPERKRGKGSKPAREVHPPARARAEDPEPSTGNAPLPIWLFIVLVLAFFWGMVYLDTHAGGFNPVVYRPYKSTNEIASLVPLDPAKEAFFKGRTVYGTVCAACHQPNGAGTANVSPPLAASEWVLEKDPARIIRAVVGGLQGPILVKGQPYNGSMPAWGPSLSDEQVAHVLTYIRQDWGNTAPPVTAEQVARIRQETASRTIPWTPEELLQIPLAQ